MSPLRAAYGVAVAGRYLLGAVAGCAAPLWCAVRGHGATCGPMWDGQQVRTVCRRCGEDV